MNNYNELYHFGVKGMKWGVRKERQWTREPEGYSIRQQKEELRLKNRYKNEQDKTKKKQFKREYKECVSIGKQKIEEYRQFEKDMHIKVGKISKIKATKNPNGTYTYSNKNGQTFKKYEVDGAQAYEMRRACDAARRRDVGVAVCSVMLTAGFGALAYSTFNE